jgi:hypothetical protein
MEYQSYVSKSGKESGVVGFIIGSDFIWVKFSKGSQYKYTNSSHLKTMKTLALQQEGLSTYISQNQPPFSEKL